MTSIRQYTAAVYEAEEGGFWAEVLDLPGCVAQGETLQELQAALPDAIEAWEETQKETGEILPRRVSTMTILTEAADDERIPA